MLDKQLQIILFTASLCFLIYIIAMVRNKNLELRYVLIWLFSGLGLIVITILPGAIDFIAGLLHIQEPVNTLFMSIIFFLIMIIFSITRVLSKNFRLVSVLTQELGIVKLELEKIKRTIN
ncbi:MAG: hypothetical protein BWY15_00526 [Firmicutes bacterium ADurb.Bin193]|nr:MAG: hypothetical protein BWY15_00526 [Firmicutes bacterium ADurb.Bin193]